MDPVLLGVVVYIVLQLGFAVVISRRIATEEDYLLAGRSLGPVLATFTVFATWFGAETCVGAAGNAYGDGIGNVSADPFGYGLCLLLMGAVFAVPLWRRKLTTLADLYRRRFDARVEKLSVFIMAPASLMWAAAQIRAFGQVLAASSELEVSLAITIAAAVVIAYTVAGGLLADVWSDLVQGIALIIGLVILTVAVVLAANREGIDLAPAFTPARLDPFPDDAPVLDQLEAWAIPVIGSVIAAELVARILAARSATVARGSALGGGAIYLLVGLMPVFLGMAGFVLFPDLEQPEQILVLEAREFLPLALYIVFVGALVSAILSTVDSALLVGASLVAHNVLAALAPEASERRKVLTNRAVVVVFGVIAYGLALSAEGVYDLVLQASAFGTAGIFTAACFALFTKRFGGPLSALACLVAGLASYLPLSYFALVPWPYLASLVAAIAGYLAVALTVERRWQPKAAAAT